MPLPPEREAKIREAELAILEIVERDLDVLSDQAGALLAAMAWLIAQQHPKTHKAIFGEVHKALAETTKVFSTELIAAAIGDGACGFAEAEFNRRDVFISFSKEQP